MKTLRRWSERILWGVSVFLLCGSLHIMAGCPGLGVSGSCSRDADGKISCTVDAHRHEEKAKP